MTAIRWYHLLVLAGIVALGAFLRFDRMGDESLWLDEYWSVHVATGRDQIGHSLLDIPVGVVLDPPPAMGFVNAPPWWHTWTGVASAGNWPPIYGIVLRWWVDLFGPGDFAMRTLSALFSLASILLLFGLLCRDQGPWPALLGAAIMSLAVYPIEFARDVRPYPMLTFFGVCITWVLFDVVRRGPAWWRLTLLGFLAFCLVLTHYLALGALLGMGLYALWRLRPGVRGRVVAAFVISGLVTAAAWGPMFMKLRPQMHFASEWLRAGDVSAPDSEAMMTLGAPFRLVSGCVREILNGWMARYQLWMAVLVDMALFAPLAWIVYVWPIRNWKRERDDIIYWWLWTVGSIGLVVVVDAVQQYRGMTYPRFYFMAFPGVCALISAYAGSKSRSRAIVVTSMIVLCLLVRNPALHRVTVPRRQWRQAAEIVDSIAGTHDVLGFATYTQDVQPALGYCVYSHYASDHRPVILLPGKESLLRDLANSGKFWVIGDNPAHWYFPRWGAKDVQPLGPDLYMWRVVPPP